MVGASIRPLGQKYHAIEISRNFAIISSQFERGAKIAWSHEISNATYFSPRDRTEPPTIRKASIWFEDSEYVDYLITLLN